MPLLNGSDVMKKKAEERSIYITEFDLTRLEELLDKIDTEGSRDSRHLQELEDELLRAEVVEPQQIPADVVTMNSRVALKDLATGEEMVYELVFPSDARLEENRISILAPVGTALLGYRAGDTISWKVPGAPERSRSPRFSTSRKRRGIFIANRHAWFPKRKSPLLAGFFVFRAGQTGAVSRWRNCRDRRRSRAAAGCSGSGRSCLPPPCPACGSRR